MKIVSWNVNGVRAAVKKDFFKQFKKMKADIFCLQETKAQVDQTAEALSKIKDYHIYSNAAIKKGYSGVTILSKVEAKKVTYGIGIEEHDTEGRVVACYYDDFIMVNVYVPNSGSAQKRLAYRQEWDLAFAKYLAKLRRKKPVIVTGDFNVARHAVDLARPKPNYNKSSGYLQEEIDGIEEIFSKGFVDAYRTMYGEKVQYTFWSTRFGARGKNIGWRIDYFLVDRRIKDQIKDSLILDKEMGSDHCPITLDVF